MILCQFSMLDPLGKERECSQYKYMYNMTECHQCELWLSTGTDIQSSYIQCTCKCFFEQVHAHVYKVYALIHVFK